ncbi:MAG: CCA tRNA nucleotidyltransferase [Candidatus Bathyarchaeia archaeon]
MPSEVERVCKQVLERVTPKEHEKIRVETLAKKLEKRVAEECEALNLRAKVRLEGSVAKNTWLSEDPEIDIFMLVPKTMPKKSLGKICLEAARKATEGSKQIERFAEHPYLEAVVEDVRVNIVPCYDVKKGEWLSATDRTPYHTDYVKKHLASEMQNEVRLLKRFMKGIGVYGAEIKVGGFSGYLCELLTLYYKSFLGVLKAFAEYKQRIVVDIENFYKGREDELQLLFREPLIIVDPVDKGRNVASAVQPQKLYTLISAARHFLKNPSLNFFYPPKTAPMLLEEFKKNLAGRGSALIFLVFGRVEAVPDVLWGQLYKSQRSLSKLIELNDFKILRETAWSDEKELNLFLFELEQRFIPQAKKHYGPPVEKKDECENFLKKYVGNSETVSGPYVEDGRWVVILHRKYTDVVPLLRERLEGDGGRRAGVAELISQSIRRGFKIFVNEEVSEIYQRNKDFAEFLTEFLIGKPKWLQNT